jgi:hypothetical protein
MVASADVFLITMHLWQYQLEGADDTVAYRHAAVSTMNSVMLQNKHESFDKSVCVTTWKAVV